MVLMRARVNNDAVLQPLSATSQRAESRSHRRRGWNARNVDDFNCDPPTLLHRRENAYFRVFPLEILLIFRRFLAINTFQSELS